MRYRSTRTILAALLAVCAAASFGVPGASAQSTPSQGPGGPVLVVTDPGDAFGTYYAEILRAEGLNEFAVTSKANLSASTLASYQVVLLAQTSLTDAQASLLDAWVAGRRQPHRHAARRAAGGPARPRRRRRPTSPTATSRSPPAPPRAPASPATRCSSTARPTAGRPTSATTVATLYSDADTRDLRRPRRDPAQRRQRRRAGRRLHLRPRALGGLHAPGQPGLGRAEARRPDRADPLRRPLLPATGWTSARSRSRRPTSSSGCWPTSSRR